MVTTRSRTNSSSSSAPVTSSAKVTKTSSSPKKKEAPAATTKAKNEQKRVAEEKKENEEEGPPNKKKTTDNKLEIGKKATKELTLLNQDSKEIKFHELFESKGAVFFMYPKANTPGCTKQACGFRDHIQEIKDAGYQVFGLSADSPKSLTNWKTKEKLAYDLLSDPKHELIKYFGSSLNGGTRIQRSHVIILKNGIVGDIQPKVSPAESVEKAVAFVTSNPQ
jgi:peroxiredoxin Q/BCP